MAKKHECSHCGKEFKTDGALKQHQADKHPQVLKSKPKTSIKIKMPSKKIVLLSIVVLIALGVAYVFLSSPNYKNPPTAGKHVEYFPDKNVFNEPIDELLQVHILEPHSASSHFGIPLERKLGGVIISYNCNFSNNCDELLSNLSDIVNKYYPRVYLQPYNVASLIALTAWNRLEKLNEYDENRIRNFICSNLIEPPEACLNP